MSILEELWYGNINPGELNNKKHSPYKELLALMIRHQDELLARLNDEEKEIFEKYADAASEMYSHTNLEASSAASRWAQKSWWRCSQATMKPGEPSRCND